MVVVDIIGPLSFFPSYYRPEKAQAAQHVRIIIPRKKKTVGPL